ncbi:hypothetical protein LIER_35916 [Lithospermum erythrorhizon]|uniref:Uncharacterized protein n=1 Tax=Lithospermum erythrorhizon TaxID=34254 RepID=A0AAV3NYF4_LITER
MVVRALRGSRYILVQAPKDKHSQLERQVALGKEQGCSVGNGRPHSGRSRRTAKNHELGDQGRRHHPLPHPKERMAPSAQPLPTWLTLPKWSSSPSMVRIPSQVASRTCTWH